MRFYSYVLPRDYGFAPNPFYGRCTLATCKPAIRERADYGDWIIGTGSRSARLGDALVLAMKVDEILTFDAYWAAPHYQCKKPVMYGSLKQMYGDNIYYRTDAGWVQLDSHHSHPGGATNTHNLNRDTSTNRVLAAVHFYYFGSCAIEIPDGLGSSLIKRGPGYRCPEPEEGTALVKYLAERYSPGIHGDPLGFSRFERYDGIS